MTENLRIRPKSQILEILRRSRLAPDAIAALDAELPDDVDLNKYGQLLHWYG